MGDQSLEVLGLNPHSLVTGTSTIIGIKGTANTSGSLGNLGSQLELDFASCFHYWQLTTELLTSTAE
jgi:hypothetical protein